MPKPSRYSRDIQLAVLIAAAAALAESTASFLAYRKAVLSSQAVYADHAGDLILSHQLGHSLERKLAKSRMFILSLEPVYLEEMDEAGSDIMKELGRFDTSAPDARRDALLEGLRRALKNHDAMLQEAITMRRRGRSAHEVGLFMADRLRPSRQEIDAALAALTALKAAEVSRSQRDARESLRYAGGVSAGAAAATAVIFVVVLLLVRKLGRRQHELEALLRDENARLDARVAERTRELSASNRELEAFSYSVAHDLRTPLRAITNFSDLALDGLPAELSPVLKERLERIRSAGLRMSALIDALLELSRLTRSPFRPVETDLSALAESAAAEIAREHPGRAVAVKIQPGLRDFCDEPLMRIVLASLFDNAWKFTAGTADAAVEFGRSGPEDDDAYFVRDNGAGFDPRFTGKLFTPFERLHSKRDFPGTGIGLATVDRIVKRHGGSAWARGERGRGAAFFFTLHRLVPGKNHGK